ncbi:MAG: HU family DNA-binding protein [Acidobacteriota bacterium]
MNKTGLVKSLAEKAGVTQKEAAKVLDAVLESIQGALAKGDKVQIIGFGTFEVRNRKARKVISPATGKEIKVPATKVPAFKPGKSLKEVVTSNKVEKKAKAAAKPKVAAAKPAAAPAKKK